MSARQLDDDTVGTFTLGGDLSVRRLGFGAMRVSGARNAEGARDRDEAVRLCRRVYERGVNLVDTANIYGYGQSEEIIAEALHPYPDDLVIATKAGYRPGKILPGHITLPPRGDPEHIRAECELSLRRLRTDCIDLYQVHAPDPSVPYADTVGAFADLQREGKVHHTGLSNVTAGQLELAQSICTIVSVQNRYNIADQESAPVLDACEQQGVAFLPWQPVLLNNSAAARAVEGVAAKHGVTSQQVSLAWLLRRSPVLVPIPGTSSVRHLDENVDAAWVPLDADDVERLSATVAG